MMLGDFLAYTLAGSRPVVGCLRGGTCANGVRWSWLDDGVLQNLARHAAGRGHAQRARLGWRARRRDRADRTAVAAGARIANGDAALTCRLLVILGNVDAMREACRYRDDDLNRLFSGRQRAGAAQSRSPACRRVWSRRQPGSSLTCCIRGRAGRALAHRHAHGNLRVRVRAVRVAAAYRQAVFARDVRVARARRASVRCCCTPRRATRIRTSPRRRAGRGLHARTRQGAPVRAERSDALRRRRRSVAPSAGRHDGGRALRCRACSR